MFTDWSKEQWHRFLIGCLWVIVSFVFFRVLQFVVRWYLFGKCTYRTFSYFGIRATAGRESNSDSRDLSAKPPNKRWRISNEVVSFIHSVVSGAWAGYCLLYDKQFIQDMVYHSSEAGLNLIFLSAGYLLHDLIDLLINEQSARIIELLFHHVVVLSAFTIPIITGRCLGVVLFGLLMELNSIFLHSRSLLNLYGVDKKSPSFRIVALLNMVTLFFCRICVCAYLIYFVISSLNILEWYLSLVNGILILSLVITNSVLTYRLLAADGLLGANRTRKSPAATTSTGVVENGAATLVANEDGEGEDVDGELHTVAVQTASGEHALVEDATQTIA